MSTDQRGFQSVFIKLHFLHESLSRKGLDISGNLGSLCETNIKSDFGGGKLQNAPR